MLRAYSGSMTQDSDGLPPPSLVLQLQHQVQRLEQEKQSALEQCSTLEQEQSTLLCEVCCREVQASALAVKCSGCILLREVCCWEVGASQRLEAGLCKVCCDECRLFTPCNPPANPCLRGGA